MWQHSHRQTFTIWYAGYQRTSSYAHFAVPRCMLTKCKARLLQSVDLKPLQKTKHEGPSGEEHGSKYMPPSTYPAPSTAKNVETSIPDAKLDTFHGNCHCGAVAYTMVSKPLNERKVISCNCSLCYRVSCFHYSWRDPPYNVYIWP